jgi:hypothetical protein
MDKAVGGVSPTRSPLFSDLVATGNLQPLRARHLGYSQSTHLSASGEVLPSAQASAIARTATTSGAGSNRPTDRDGIPL